MTEQRPTWEPRLIVIELEDPITPLQAARNALKEDTSKICHLESRMRAVLNEYIKDLETENDALVEALEELIVHSWHNPTCAAVLFNNGICTCGKTMATMKAETVIEAAKGEQQVIK